MKPTVMILGSGHLANPGMDGHIQLSEWMMSSPPNVSAKSNNW